MKTLFIQKELKYIGSQLAPHFIYKNYNIKGDAIISFIGGCDVDLKEMVDIEDVINVEPIYSEKMVHFIAEFFNTDLVRGVYMQRLLVTTIKETLENDYGAKVLRSGDDLFINGKKLSVSIATKSLTSVLIHTALNVVTDNTPLPTSGLGADLDIVKFEDLKNFSEKVMKNFSDEVKEIYLATTKVRGVI